MFRLTKSKIFDGITLLFVSDWLMTDVLFNQMQGTWTTHPRSSGVSLCVCVCVDITLLVLCFQLRQEVQLLKLDFEVKGHMMYPRENFVISMKTT